MRYLRPTVTEPTELAEPAPVDLDAETERLARGAMPYLQASGWLNSRRLKMPVDAEDRPLPWWTYPVIDFLARRVRPDMDVFEFGSGNSTLWLAGRVDHVVAVEHHPRWAVRMAQHVPENVDLLHVPLETDGDYCRTSARTGRRFDLVAIDGRDRVNCARQCLGALKEDGVIVWDDSQRKRYRPGFRFLARRGFRRLEFVGHGPMDSLPWETSVFYRDGNCLGI
jgi:predicted O-methyltransferase YrrM